MVSRCWVAPRRRTHFIGCIYIFNVCKGCLTYLMEEKPLKKTPPRCARKPERQTLLVLFKVYYNSGILWVVIGVTKLIVLIWDCHSATVLAYEAKQKYEIQPFKANMSQRLRHPNGMTEWNIEFSDSLVYVLWRSPLPYILLHMYVNPFPLMRAVVAETCWLFKEQLDSLHSSVLIWVMGAANVQIHTVFYPFYLPQKGLRHVLNYNYGLLQHRSYLHCTGL